MAESSRFRAKVLGFGFFECSFHDDLLPPNVVPRLCRVGIDTVRPLNGEFLEGMSQNGRLIEDCDWTIRSLEADQGSPCLPCRPGQALKIP